MSDRVGRSHLRVSHVWNDEVMADRILLEPETVTLGKSSGVTFVMPALGLPDRFEVVRPGARGYLLTLGAGVTGRLRLAGEEIDVAEFVTRRCRARPTATRTWSVRPPPSRSSCTPS